MRRRPIRLCRAWRSKTSGRVLEAAGEWPLAVLLVVARTWLSIRVDLVSGLGGDYWPRPGRIFAAARSHSFRELAGASAWSLGAMHPKLPVQCDLSWRSCFSCCILVQQSQLVLTLSGARNAGSPWVFASDRPSANHDR
jgi:hypothetical protein